MGNFDPNRTLRPVNWLRASRSGSGEVSGYPLKVVFCAAAALFAAHSAKAVVLPTYSGPGLPDRLPRKASSEFAVAADRAQLERRYRKMGLGLDWGGVPSDHPHFYTWTVIPTLGQGVRYYWVDRRTATVWGGYVNCEPIHGAPLAALQARFRRRYHLTQSEVRRIEREGSPLAECSS
jgi:hypothetical protein